MNRLPPFFLVLIAAGLAAPIPSRGADPRKMPSPVFTFAVALDPGAKSSAGDLVLRLLADRPAAILALGGPSQPPRTLPDAFKAGGSAAEVFSVPREAGTERGVTLRPAWFSVERGGVHLAFLDPGNDLTRGSAQAKWLEEDLKGASTPFLAVVSPSPLPEEAFSILNSAGTDLVVAPGPSYRRSREDGVHRISLGSDHGKTPYLRVLVEGGGMQIQVLYPEGMGMEIDRLNIPLRLRPARPAPGSVPNCCGHWAP